MINYIDVTSEFTSLTGYTVGVIEFYDAVVEDYTVVERCDIESVQYNPETKIYVLENMDGLVFEFTEYELKEV